ncbi:hypothetical protein, partial [Enterobacter cloacae]
FVGKTLLHGDVLMWLMKTLLTSGCTNQRGAGQRPTRERKLLTVISTSEEKFGREVICSIVAKDSELSAITFPYLCVLFG